MRCDLVSELTNLCRRQEGRLGALARSELDVDRRVRSEVAVVHGVQGVHVKRLEHVAVRVADRARANPALR